MRKRIILLTECGADIGFGHVTRCGAVAAAFRSEGFVVELWVATDEAAARRLPAGDRAVCWYDVSAPAAVELAQAGAVIVDSLVATAAQIERISKINSRFAVIDDWRRSAHERGVVIDWTIGAEHFAYPKRHPAVRYLLGSAYCALRGEFAIDGKRSFEAEPRSVLITFGGSDPRGLTGPVLSRLRSDFPGLKQHVIVGGAVRDRSFLAQSADERTTFHVDCTGEQMSTLMAGADLAVCAGGQTLYELAARGVPTVVVRVVDNQTDDLREFEAVGFASLAGDWNARDCLDRIAAQVRALWPENARRARSMRGGQCVDGRGAQRLARACVDCWDSLKASAPVACLV